MLWRKKAAKEFEKNIKNWGIEDFLALMTDPDKEPTFADDKKIVDRTIALLSKSKAYPKALARLKEFAEEGYEL